MTGVPVRREDDLVGPDGEPVSAAHKLIYDHIGKCKIEIIAAHEETAQQVEAAHVQKYHTDLIAGQSAVEVREAAADMKRIMPGLLDFIYGPPILDPVTREPRIDRDGHVWRDEKKGAQHAVKNGGFRAAIPKWMVAIIIALIGMSGSIGVAVIEHSADTQRVIDEVVDQLRIIQQMEITEPTLP